VEANQNTAFDNTSAQSRLGEHWPLNSGLAVSCFRKQISVQEKANFLAASLEQSLPLLELCTFKFIPHTVAENVSNRHL